MDITIQYQGICESPWMNEYLEAKLGRLERYLPSAAHVRIDLVCEGCRNFSHLSVRTNKHDYAFRSEGQDLFEAFSESLEEALRIIRHDHHLIIEKVHRKFAERVDLFGLE